VFDDRAALPRAGDRDTATASKLEQALVAQSPQCAQHRISVDAENGGEVTRRREPLARLRLPFGDRAAELGGHLFVEAQWLVAVDLDT